MENKNPAHESFLSPRTLRHAWLLALGALAGALWAYVATLRQPVEYASDSRMFVSGRVTLPDASSAYSEELANFLGTQAEIMRSKEVLDRARQRVQLDQPGLHGDARLDIHILPGTSIFTLSATGGRADYCRAYLDALMAEFIQFKRERRLVTSQTTIEQVSAELSRLDHEIDTQEQTLLRFQERNNISFWEQQTVSSARFLADLKSREAALRMQLSVMDSWEHVAADRGLSDSAEITDTGTVSLAESPELSQARLKLDSLVVERDELVPVLKPAHPKLIRLNDEIDRQQKVIALGIKKLHARRAERRAAVQAELDGLSKSVAEWEAKSLESSGIEAEYQKIRGGLDRTRELYNRMLSSLQNLDSRKGFDQELVQILQAASPASPVDRKLRSHTFSGLLVGACFGLGLVFLASRLDQRAYSTEEAIDRLGCPSLAEIPRRPSGPMSAARRKMIDSAFDESFRRLRSLSLLGLSADTPPVFLVTSAMPTEGKSEIALNLARAFARLGRRVLLVDADLRRGRLHHALQSGQNTPGLSEWLLGEAPLGEVVRPTPEPNLFLVTTGRTSSHASELFSTRDLVGRFESLRAGHDIVILDTAPVGPVDDTNQLVPLATRVLFVVRMRHTQIRQAVKSLATLRLRGAKNIGIVFNRVSQEGDRYYYAYHRR